MKILVADDCFTTRGVLRKNLMDWGYEPVLAEDGQAALQALRILDGPQLAILDWAMPKLEGPSVCRELRGRQSERYTYIIVLTARGGENSLVEALEAGADDFLTKPVSAKELKQRICAGKRIVDLQDRLLKSHRKQAMMATHDQLTGVLNRTSLMDQLGQELERSQKSCRHVSFLVLGVDRFNSINDAVGRLVGDEALKQVAARLRQSVNSYDSVGRSGGAEFAVILPETELPQAIVVAERLRRSVDGQPFQIDGCEVEMTASVGVGSTSGTGFDRKRLVGAADRALQQAKQDGRNCSRISVANDVIIDPLAAHPQFVG